MPIEVTFHTTEPPRDEQRCADCGTREQSDLEHYWWWNEAGEPVVLCPGCWTRRHQVVAE